MQFLYKVIIYIYLQNCWPNTSHPTLHTPHPTPSDHKLVEIVCVCLFIYIYIYLYIYGYIYIVLKWFLIIVIVAFALIFVVATCVALCQNKLCNSNLHCNDPTLAVKWNWIVVQSYASDQSALRTLCEGNKNTLQQQQR